MWKFLFNLFFLGAVPGEPDDSGDLEDPDDPKDPDDSDDLEDADDPKEPDDPGEPEEPKLSRSQRAIISSRERAQRAEEALRVANEELSRARAAQSSTQPVVSEEQRLWQSEEERLHDPAIDEWQRYAIQSARAARQANANSQAAVRRAEDLADLTRFERIMSEKPKLYGQYKDRIENGLAELRNRGMNAPREKMLAILIGEDMINGKLKSTTHKGSAKPVGSRSDVNRKEPVMDDAARRAKRLENVRI